MKRPSLEKFRRAAEATRGNLTRIADIFGVSRSTIYNWTESPEYGAIIEEQRGAVVDEAIEAARWLSTGRAKFDDDGRFLGWIERPDGQTLRWLLGTFGKREGFGEETTVKANITLESLTDPQLDEVARRLAREIKNEEGNKESEETTMYGRDITNKPLELDEI